MTSYIFTDLLNRAPAEVRQSAADAKFVMLAGYTDTV